MMLFNPSDNEANLIYNILAIYLQQDFNRSKGLDNDHSILNSLR